MGLSSKTIHNFALNIMFLNEKIHLFQHLVFNIKEL